ncbi:MAG: hypothetical protein KAT70_01070, partial [Thermoplasmata archaeon]|nr:hypothetical protein [Thermoplasmata archaeon]
RPFAEKVLVSDSFMLDFGAKKEIRYNGFPFGIYLHPKYFSPDPSVLEEMGVARDEFFSIVRCVAWGASHDIGQTGMGEHLEEIVRMLEEKGRVFLSSEDKLPPELEKYKLYLKGDRMLHLMAYASMYVGEGGTMACEAACMGTPSVFVNTLELGYINSLRDDRKLLRTAKNGEEAKKEIEDLLVHASKKEWLERKDRMWEELEDVVEKTVEIIEKMGKS